MFTCNKYIDIYTIHNTQTQSVPCSQCIIAANKQIVLTNFSFFYYSIEDEIHEKQFKMKLNKMKRKKNEQSRTENEMMHTQQYTMLSRERERGKSGRNNNNVSHVLFKRKIG